MIFAVTQFAMAHDNRKERTRSKIVLSLRGRKAKRRLKRTVVIDPGSMGKLKSRLIKPLNPIFLILPGGRENVRNAKRLKAGTDV